MNEEQQNGPQVSEGVGAKVGVENTALLEKKEEPVQTSGVVTSSSVPVGILTRKKTLLIAGSVLMALVIFSACFVSWGFYLQKDKQNVQVASEKQDKKLPVNAITKNTMDTITFNGNTYTKGFTFPPTKSTDSTSESYEWVTGGETLENWTTLLTTHKLSPVSADKPLSAEAYAQNVATLNKDRGAVIIETSLINTPDAIAGGVDAKNPPYLLVYAFPTTSSSDPVEVSIQKVINGDNGTVIAFIYGLRIAKVSDVDTYFKSEDFTRDRLSVIKAELPK